jgi:hypothetical protein
LAGGIFGVGDFDFYIRKLDLGAGREREREVDVERWWPPRSLPPHSPFSPLFMEDDLS